MKLAEPIISLDVVYEWWVTLRFTHPTGNYNIKEKHVAEIQP